jgi:hypothetical protein
MPTDPGACFERDYACTETEWLSWLPVATQGQPCVLAPGSAQVQLGAHALGLRWQPLPPRRIALLTLPRLLVRFDFGTTPVAERAAFLRRFDLATQRGGG